MIMNKDGFYVYLESEGPVEFGMKALKALRLQLSLFLFPPSSTDRLLELVACNVTPSRLSFLSIAFDLIFTRKKCFENG